MLFLAKRFRGFVSGSFLILIAGLLTNSIFIGCSQKESYTPGTFSAVYNQTLKTACIECHVPGGAATSDGVRLDFSTQDLAYQTLTTETVGGAVGGQSCGSVKIVEPGDPSASYLAAVLIQSYYDDLSGLTSCQPYSVHLQDQHLSADEQSSLTTWIANGALNN